MFGFSTMKQHLSCCAGCAAATTSACAVLRLDTVAMAVSIFLVLLLGIFR